MAVDVNRFPDFDSGEVRAFIYDCFYYLSEVGGETLCKEKGGGFRGFPENRVYNSGYGGLE